MKAMILAAGRGERMRPLTDRLPKPLLEAGGKPLIVWQIERLRAAGFTDLVINHAHLGEALEAALGDGRALGVRIAWSREGEPLETAGGIATALPLLGEAPFVLANGDVYADFDFTRLRAAAQTLSAEGDLAHLVMVPNPNHHAGGDFALHPAAEGAAHLQRANGGHSVTYGGLAAYHPAMFAGIAAGQKLALRPVLDRVIAAGRIRGELFDGPWVDVGTPERLAELDRQLTSTLYP